MGVPDTVCSALVACIVVEEDSVLYPLVTIRNGAPALSLGGQRALAELGKQRQPRGRPWFDAFDACLRLMVDLEAVTKGRACWIPRPERELSEDDRAARRARVESRKLIAEADAILASR